MTGLIYSIFDRVRRDRDNRPFASRVIISTTGRPRSNFFFFLSQNFQLTRTTAVGFVFLLFASIQSKSAPPPSLPLQARAPSLPVFLAHNLQHPPRVILMAPEAATKRFIKNKKKERETNFFPSNQLTSYFLRLPAPKNRDEGDWDDVIGG